MDIFWIYEMARNLNYKFESVPYLLICGRHSSLIVSALVSGSSPGQGHCVLFFGKAIYSHSASVHPGVSMGTGELKVTWQVD